MRAVNNFRRWWINMFVKVDTCSVCTLLNVFLGEPWREMRRNYRLMAHNFKVSPLRYEHWNFVINMESSAPRECLAVQMRFIQRTGINNVFYFVQKYLGEVELWNDMPEWTLCKMVTKKVEKDEMWTRNCHFAREQVNSNDSVWKSIAVDIEIASCTFARNQHDNYNTFYHQIGWKMLRKKTTCHNKE